MVGELRLTKKIFVSAQIRDLWHTVRDGMHFIHFEHHDLIITAHKMSPACCLSGYTATASASIILGPLVFE